MPRSYSIKYPLDDQSAALQPEGTLGKADRVVEQENKMAPCDSDVVCKFSWDYTSVERFDADFEAALDEYYDERGWFENGTVSGEVLGY